MGRGIPNRWEKYSPVGCRVPGTRFLPFKVPLKPELIRQLPEAEWFTPSVLVEGHPSLRAIIDLTNTSRYYNYEEFTKRGLLYKKINIVGGGTVPTKRICDEFFDAVEELSGKLEQDSDALIGVHCTHGLNRTGYLICKYMVLRLKIDPQEAINKFQEARGHEIERNNYVSNIVKETSCDIKCETDNWRERCRNLPPYPEDDGDSGRNWRPDLSRFNHFHDWRNEPYRRSFHPRGGGWRQDSRPRTSHFRRNDDYNPVYPSPPRGGDLRQDARPRSLHFHRNDDYNPTYISPLSEGGSSQDSRPRNSHFRRNDDFYPVHPPHRWRHT